MNIGSQIVAPEGWDQLPKGLTFYFLKNDYKRGRVLLVQFGAGRNCSGYSAHLLTISRTKFEHGLKLEKIVPAEDQLRVPPWLKPLEGTDLSQIDRFRPHAKMLHSERVENRFLAIAQTVREFDSILSAEDPSAEINKRARLCCPSQNESRFRLWVLTYCCFGQDIWMLLPPFHVIGHWDRRKFPERKFGAPSLAYGRSYGSGLSEEMCDFLVKCYIKRAKLGVPMTDIYEDVMVHDLGCRTVKAPSGMRHYVHPQGNPFPTFCQFKYRVQLAVGIESIQMNLYGAVRHRAKIAASKGAFTEEIANLMERIEVDGYYTKERPKGYVEGTSLPPLCVVIGRDVLSGKKLGIGFSFGAEHSTAYRMMLFCMAVPKDYFCRLFGVPYTEGEWVNEGLPAHFSIDRGPGARRQIIEDYEKRFPIKDLAPSWMGQSKATVEGSHPRDIKIDGQPTYIESGLTPVQLAKKEIMRLMRYNHAANMEARFEPDADLALVPPTPIALWNHYDKLFRNDAQPMRIDEAVRTFLTPVEFSLREDGAWLTQRRFDSDEFRDTGIQERIARLGDDGVKINGFILDMCVRYVWVEVEGRLLLVGAKLRLRGDEETLYTSIEELNQWGDVRKKIQSAFGVHQSAVSSEYKYRFYENTGKAWNSVKRRAGKLKRNTAARQEELEARQATSSRRAA